MVATGAVPLLLVAPTSLLAAQELVEATPAGQLVLFPQLFLAAVVLLDGPWAHLHAAALDLFSKVAPPSCIVPGATLGVA